METRVAGIVKQAARAVIPRSVRNVLRAPGRAAWWSLAEVRHFLGMDTTLEIRDGFSLRSHPAAYRLAYHFQFDDPEQATEFDSFVAECDAGMRLIDVGAHFGLFSFAALHYGGPAARAVAVDASPSAIRMLREQARINGMSARVEPVCAAAGAEEGWMEMLPMGPEGAGYFLPMRRGHGSKDMLRTPVTTIDILAARHGAPTHVKIDVESFEAEVLKGGRDTFSSPDRPKLFLEVHNAMVRERGARAEEALELVLGYGYEIFDLTGRPRSRDDVLAAELTRVVCLSPGVRARGVRAPAAAATSVAATR
jgi:FkbM family methyltransferase